MRDFAMRRALMMGMVLMPLGAAYAQVPVPGYAYPPPVYVAPAYAQPVYMAPPVVVADPYAGIYPGYAYNNGAPTMLVGGVVFPLVFVGGAWGYWGPGHAWFRAPNAVFRHLEERRRAGVVFRVGGPMHAVGGPGRMAPREMGHPGGGREPEHRR
jgi:hypothetical protein